MKDIAVIIPVYNGAKLLESCISSISSAGSRVREIIIVNDGSTDNTGLIADRLKEKDERIVVIHTENHGSYMARRTGIKTASSSYVAFIDVDDRFYPDALDKLADLLEQQDADIAFGRFIETKNPCAASKSFYQTETMIRIQTPEQMWPRIMKWKTQEFILYIWHKLYRKELFDDLPEADGICQGDDVILTCKAFMNAQRIVETSDLVYLYYINPEGLTHRGFSDSDLDLVRVWDIVVNMLDGKSTRGGMDLGYLARYNRWRTDFTLMMRLILTDDKHADKKYAEELKKWQDGLKMHWKDLISPRAMPLNREVLILSLRFFFLPTRALLRIMKRIRGSSTGIILHSGEKN